MTARHPRCRLAGVIGLIAPAIAPVIAFAAATGPALADDVLHGHARRGAVYQRLTLTDPDPLACAAVCHDDDMCQSWVWTRAELTGSGGTGSGCSLLSAAPTPYRAPGQVTGLGRALTARIDAAAEREPSARELPALRATLRGPY